MSAKKLAQQAMQRQLDGQASATPEQVADGLAAMQQRAAELATTAPALYPHLAVVALGTTSASTTAGG